MRLRRPAIVLALLGGAIAGCAPGSAPPSTSATGTPSPSSALPTAAPTAPVVAAPSPWIAPYPIVRLAGDAVRTVDLPEGFSIHRPSASGSRVVFDQSGWGSDDPAAGRSIFYADLSTETLRPLVTAEHGDAAWTPVISGDDVAWVEWRYADSVNSRGDLSWRIRTLRLPDGEPHTIATGVNRRLEGGQGVPPALSIDGGQLAYTVESPTPSSPLGWKVIVRDVASGAIRRSLQTRFSVYSVALSDGSVAYSEGLVDQAANSKYATRLMFWRRGSDAAVKVADDAFEVALGGSTIAWVSDATASQGRAGLAQRPWIWVASTDDLVARPAGHEPDGVISWGGLWPASGGGFVTWADKQDTPSHPDSTGDHLVIWDNRTDRAYQVEPTAGLDLSGVGEGWLVWHSEWDPVPVWRGVRLEALALPAEP